MTKTKSEHDEDVTEESAYDKAVLKEQEAQRKAARDGTESPDPANGVRADRAEDVAGEEG